MVQINFIFDMIKFALGSAGSEICNTISGIIKENEENKEKIKVIMKKTVFDTVIAGAGGLAAFLFGGLDGVLYALIAMVCLDYLTGVINAITKKGVSSKVGFDGIKKKIMIFIVVAVANVICTYVLNTGGVLRVAVIFFFIANEGLSILENAGSMGLPIPQKLLDVLAQLKNNDNQEQRKDGIIMSETTKRGKPPPPSLSLPSGTVPKGTKVEIVNPEYMEVHYFLDGDSNDIKLHNGEPFIINGDTKITLFGRVSMKLTDFVEFDFKVEKGQENE